MDFEPIETQEQFDAAIKSRLARDRADSLREARSRVSWATGVPAELIRGEDGGEYSTRPGADLARTGPRLVQPLESILFTAM